MAPRESTLDVIARGLAGGMSRREALRIGGAALVGAITATPTDAVAALTGHCPPHRVRCHGKCCPRGEMCLPPQHKGGKHHCGCPSHMSRCSGSCVDVHRDVHNCGACGHACSAGQVCASGTCMTECPAGQTVCAGACIDLATDVHNCGMCGMACAAGTMCANGACVTQCPAGTTNCNGACVDVMSDVHHCGSCTTVCATGMTCVAGTCACPAGTAVCGGVCVNQMTDAGHCGANCVNCNALPFVTRAHCANGTCVIDQCAPMWLDCDGNPLNGCEYLGTVCPP